MKNNETVRKFDITIKLRWVASRGSCDNIISEVRDIVRGALIGK